MTGRPRPAPFAAALPEPRAFRILFRRPGMLPGFLLFWGASSLVFVLLMTYRSFRPFTLEDALVAGGFGGLIPFSLLLTVHARTLGRLCGKRAGGGPATASVLGAFVALASCACCLPVMPLLLGVFLGGTAFAAHAVSFGAALMVWAPALYALSAGLLFGSMHLTSRRLVQLADLAT